MQARLVQAFVLGSSLGACLGSSLCKGHVLTVNSDQLQIMFLETAQAHNSQGCANLTAE